MLKNMVSYIVINKEKGTLTRLYTLHKLYPDSIIIMSRNKENTINHEYIDWLRGREDNVEM